MLKIGFDVRMIESSGIGIRIQKILENWNFEQEVELFLFGDPDQIKLFKYPKSSNIIEYRAPIYSMQELIGHPRMIQMDHLEIPHFNVPILFLYKSFVTVHDLIPLHFKEIHGSFIKQFYLRLVFFCIKYLSKGVIAVSNFTKKDLVESLNFNPNKIEVIPNGFEEELVFDSEEKSFKEKYKLPDDYYLAVGIDKPHKNISFVLSCLVELWERGEIPYPLVIAGRDGSLTKEMLEINEKFPDKILSFPKVSYKELMKLFRSARIFIYPSLMEGFGFPGLEAQAVGLPVYASHAGSLPEVLGNGAIYFDPKDKSHFQKRLLRLEANHSQWPDLIQRGRENARGFLWTKSLSLLKNLYYQKKILA